MCLILKVYRNFVFMLQPFVANKEIIGDYDGERRKDYNILMDEPAGQYVVESSERLTLIQT